MKLSLHARLFATLAYADIFDFPLTRTELAYWLIGKKGAGRQLSQSAKRYKSGKYYRLPGREEIVAIRRRRLIASNPKWLKARRVVSWLSWIPSVVAAGVSGALSVNNAERRDDIDIMIVTYPGTLWVTRLLAVLCVELLGMRRRPRQKTWSDAICLNMFLSASASAVLKAERTLFLAHEIVQLEILFDRSHWYGNYLKINDWVADFLPEAWERKMTEARSLSEPVDFPARHFLVWVLQQAEMVSKLFQLWYMRGRRTTEKIDENQLRFHPHDASIWVRRNLAKRLSGGQIPLDKIFLLPIK